MDHGEIIGLGMKAVCFIVCLPVILFCGAFLLPILGVGWLLGWLISQWKPLRDFVEDIDV